MSDQIIKFYRGTGTDDKGRTLTDIINFTDEELEFTHDYIQWLFPNEIPSGCREGAPLLTVDDCLWFTVDALMDENVCKVLSRMYDFYGFGMDGGFDNIIQKPDFYTTRKRWFMPNNHNKLRLTRMIKFLQLIGYTNEADGLFDALATVYAQNPTIVGRETLTYWLNAANIEPWLERSVDSRG